MLAENIYIFETLEYLSESPLVAKLGIAAVNWEGGILALRE